MSTTVAEALSAFRRASGLSPEDRLGGPFLVRLGPITLRFPDPGMLHRHDLHHLVLDAPPTFWGEVQVSAFELRTGSPTPLITLLCVGALALGFFVSPRGVIAAWKRARGCRNLYRDATPDATLRAGSVDDLRARVGLTR